MFFEQNDTEKSVDTTNSHLQSEAINALGERITHRSQHPRSHDQGHTPGRHPRAPQESSLHQSLKPSEPIDSHNDGKYAVQNGDTLWSIARRSLVQQGAGSENVGHILQEIERITSLNASRYPDLEKHPHSIKVGMFLNTSIKDETSAKNELPPSAEQTHPETVCAKTPLQVAEPGEITLVKNCERVVAGPGTCVIVEAGGQAYAHDATAIVFRGGQVLAHGGYVLGQTTSEQDEKATSLRNVAHATRVATNNTKSNL